MHNIELSSYNEIKSTIAVLSEASDSSNLLLYLSNRAGRGMMICFFRSLHKTLNDDSLEFRR